MAPILRHLATARTRHDVIRATARFVEEDTRQEPVPLPGVGKIRVESETDIDQWIDRLQDAMRERPLMARDEERVDRLVSLLLVASIRARQVS